jgi:hypothetical protein
MPPGKPKSRLEESWVVEGGDEEESPEYSLEEEYSPAPKAAPRRATRSGNRSPEPELVMPSLDAQTLEASWADTSSRSVRPRKARRPAEKKPRRGASHQVEESGSPKERVKTKNAAKNIIPSTSQSLSSVARRTTRDASALQRVLDFCFDYIATMASWLLEVFGGALLILKRPVSYLLAAWLLFGMSVMIRNLVTNSVYASLSPICRMPGVSYLDLPFCPAYKVDTSNGSPPPVEFDKLMSMQAQFEEVMEDSANSVSLPMDMKRGEASIRDLRQLVRYSQLSSK